MTWSEHDEETTSIGREAITFRGVLSYRIISYHIVSSIGSQSFMFGAAGDSTVS
jgi:hypothetical protein